MTARISQYRQRVDVIVNVDTGETDERNDTVLVATTIENVPAKVDIVQSTEDPVERDQVIVMHDVQLPPRWAGVSMELDSDARLIYRGDTLDLVGMAEMVFDGMGRPDHVEILARKLVG